MAVERKEAISLQGDVGGAVAAVEPEGPAFFQAGAWPQFGPENQQQAPLLEPAGPFRAASRRCWPCPDLSSMGGQLGAGMALLPGQQQGMGASYLQWPQAMQPSLRGMPPPPPASPPQYFQAGPPYPRPQEAAPIYAQWQPASSYGQWPPQSLPAPALLESTPNAPTQWSQQAYQGAAVAYEPVPQAAWQAPQALWGGAPTYGQQLPQMLQQSQQGEPLPQMVQEMPQGAAAMQEQVPLLPPAAPEYMMPMQPVRFLG